ncbi:MAG TPA: HAMP domain-containing sensor histidine kinase [Nitrososphaeraceae archaeon]
MIGVDAIKNERLKAKNRGVNFRYITQITNENLYYCKELSKFAELRHLNGVKGNFEVSRNRIGGGKGEYIGTSALQEAKPVAQLIYSNAKEIVEQQSFVFDTLWNKAITFEVRLKEIEEGIKPESIEIIVNPKEALETEYRLLKSAKDEVLMIFSTVNTFLLQERQLGITQILTNLSMQGVSIKILTPIDKDIEELVFKLKNQQEEQRYQHQEQGQQLHPYQKNNAGKSTNTNINTNNTNSNIDIQDIAPSSSINAKILVVDKQNSLAMEIKDGTKDELHDTIGLSTYSNSKSTIASYFAIFENLSKQNQLYNQLKVAYKKVEDANAIQREFINIAAHELKTPIQPILGYAELLLEEESDGKKKQAIMGIVRNSERLQKLASDILDVAKIESNNFQLNKKSLNLNSLMTKIIKDYVKRVEQHKIQDITGLISNVNGDDGGDGSGSDNDNDTDGKTMGRKLVLESKVNKEDNTFFVEADEERLTQVIYNIFDNALKFTDSDGSVIVTVEKEQVLQPQLQQLGERIEKGGQREQKQKQQYAIISIKDTGLGIHPEILPRLFSKFATKSHKGTGLSLYICKNIIEAHDGILYATNNTDGKGATFTIILPLVVKIKE